MTESARMTKRAARFVGSFLRCEKGLAITEYGLLVACMAIIVVAVVIVMGGGLSSWFSSKTTTITTN